MRVQKIRFFILVFSLILASCDNFENRFSSKLIEAQKESIESGTPQEFNLEDITEFEWVKMMHVFGNESVPVKNFEIEPYLQQETTDLPTNKNRFYFLNSDNELIVKEINHKLEPSYSIEFCLEDSTEPREFYQWLTKEQCVFTLIPNTEIARTGTVFLFPKCRTKFDVNNFGIFHLEE